MPISITKLRIDLYKIVDQVIKTGVPVEIERYGQKVQIIAIAKKSKLHNLSPHSGTIVGDPDELVHIDWSSEWNEDDSL